MKLEETGQLRHWQDISLNFLAKEQLLKEPSQLQRKVFIIEIATSPRIQEQIIQEVTNENDISEINGQFLNSVGAGMSVISYIYTRLTPNTIGKVVTLEDHEASRKRKKR